MLNKRLSEKEIEAVTHALIVAAERFEDNAKRLVEVIDSTCAHQPDQARAYRALAEQFEHQAKDSRALAEQIEASDAVELHGVAYP